MKLETFLKQIETMEPSDMQSFWEKSYVGSCPCFSGTKRVDGKSVSIWGRCWRVSNNLQDLHITGTLDKKTLRKIGNIIKKKLDEQEWYNPYTLIIGNYD